MIETVILGHGLWVTSVVMRPLARRVERCGFQAGLCNYHSLSQTIQSAADAVIQCVRQQAGKRVHLVGHSLGGLLILQALQDEPALSDGRGGVVGCRGKGGVVASRGYRREGSRWLVGRGAEGRLAWGGAGWHGSQQLGVIAGKRPVGVGRALGGLEGPNDGTVTVAETRLQGCTESLLVNTTHTGLVCRGDVTQAVCRFLQAGRFGAGA